MTPDLGAIKWNPGVIMFDLEQRKVRVIWDEFEDHLQGHNSAEGTSPQSRDFNDIDLTLVWRVLDHFTRT